MHGFDEFFKNVFYNVTPITKCGTSRLPKGICVPFPVTLTQATADFPSTTTERCSSQHFQAQNQPARSPWSAFSSCTVAGWTGGPFVSTADSCHLGWSLSALSVHMWVDTGLRSSSAIMKGAAGTLVPARGRCFPLLLGGCLRGPRSRLVSVCSLGSRRPGEQAGRALLRSRQQRRSGLVAAALPA